MSHNGGQRNYAFGGWQKYIWYHRESEYIEDPETYEYLDQAVHAAQEAADRQESYQYYLCGNYWQEVVAKVKERAQGRCEGCGTLTNKLEIHHKKYPRRGTELENLHLLLALCRRCHAASHGR